jgi:hypothetical protein
MIARSFAGRKERAIMRKLPHQKLVAYEVAMKLLESVRDARIRDAHLRDQAMRAAKSAVLNTAEVAPGKTWEEEA